MQESQSHNFKSYLYSNDTDFSVQSCTQPKAAPGSLLQKILFFCCDSNSCLQAILFFLPTLLCIFPSFNFVLSQHTPVHCNIFTASRFKIFASIHVNNTPCSGFMKKSPSISCIEQYATLTYPFLILSVTKKYLMSRWHVHCLDVLPFSANGIILLLSW